MQKCSSPSKRPQHVGNVGVRFKEPPCRFRSRELSELAHFKQIDSQILQNTLQQHLGRLIVLSSCFDCLQSAISCSECVAAVLVETWRKIPKAFFERLYVIWQDSFSPSLLLSEELVPIRLSYLHEFKMSHLLHNQVSGADQEAFDLSAISRPSKNAAIVFQELGVSVRWRRVFEPNGNKTRSWVQTDRLKASE